MPTSPWKASPLTSDSVRTPGRAILVFVDGVGIAAADPQTNPFAHASLDHLRSHTAGLRPVTEDLPQGRVVLEGATLAGIDANLEMEGLPQSGTGQSSILTGLNAAHRFGRHFGPWVPTSLRPLLAQESLFARFPTAGLRVQFANAYPTAEYSPPAASLRRPGAFPLAALAAGMLTRREPEVRQGRALVSSITTRRWREMIDPRAPDPSPAEAARMLVDIHGTADLTVFAHYDTDYIGHRRGMDAAIGALEKLDAFLGTLADLLPRDTLLLVVSDHGNLERVGVGHTRNPALMIAIGAGHEQVDAIRSVSDVTPVLAGLLLGKRAGEARGSQSGEGDYLKR